MLTSEPLPTAVTLAIFGLLLVVSVLFSRATERVSIPVAAIFLAIGMLAGSEGLGGIAFEDYGLAYRLGTVALVLILFDGGFNTPISAVRRVAAPAAVLATVGVVGTAALLAVGAHALGFPWPAAMLLGAVVSSTDAAAVFAVLRGSGLQLQRRVGATLEIESGANDPMAVILTTVVTRTLVEPGAGLGWSVLLTVLTQVVVGGALGVAIGYGGRLLLARVRLAASGLYAVLLVGLAFLAFAVPTLLAGSGFLAVYIAAIVLGNGALPYKAGLLRVHDALAWLSQVTMFLVMGLLVFPTRLLQVAPVGLLVAAFLTLVARPLVVWLCLLPFRYPAREVAYICWVGLRGAVPIILAAYPVLAGAPGAERIFDTVFFVVVTSAFLPGATVAWLARRLGLESTEPPAPLAVLEIESAQPLNGELVSFYIDEALAVAGARLADLPFPRGTSVTLIVRGGELLAPRGDTVLQPGDHAYVFSRPEEKPLVQLMFGRPERR
ncbi:MAG TPA: potassium/proton antiporter [Gemmatimonadaceae bacterium]|nr:potassium/proton antiporter [Gemmatimonadaceae bacterium]